jgi:hypothetical protein
MDFDKIISFYIKDGYEKGNLTVVFPRGSGKMKIAKALAEELDGSVCIAEFSDGKGRSKWGVLVDKGLNQDFDKMNSKSIGEEADDGNVQNG